MIKYLGSKKSLLDKIVRVVRGLPDNDSVVDLFSGTARVGHALKSAGYRVFSNDHNRYSSTLAQCYVQANRSEHEEKAQKLIKELNRIPGEPGYFTETFCEKSRFFHPKNGARVDSMREAIDGWDLPPELRSIMLVSLMEAADRVDSTCGVQMAYLKKWAPRAHNEISLRLPKLLEEPPAGKCQAFNMDALEATEHIEADVAYLDPPYNQHSYLANYHIWESLVLWDKPEVYGVACKREDVRTRKSLFNRKREAKSALQSVVENIKAKHLVVSFNNEGFISKGEMEEMLSLRGQVATIENDFKRYVGAQIGIFNQSGDKVGEVSHLTNKEYLYVVSEDLEKFQMEPLERETRPSYSRSSAP